MALGENQRTASLLEAGLALASELDLEAVLQRIVELATEVTGARYGALGVLSEDGRISEFETVGITKEQRRAIGHLPVGRGILGALIEEAKPLRLREIARDPRSVGFPPNHPPMSSFLGAPVQARGKVYGNIYLTEKRGAEEFSAEDELALVALAAQAGVAIENAHLYEETRARERRLEALREIGDAILEGRDPDAVLRLVAGRARELARADVATVAVPAPGGSRLVLRVADGAHAEDLEGIDFPLEPSASGEAMRTGQPLMLNDASSDDRLHQPIVRIGHVGPVMLVPLMAQGRGFGTLAVGNTTGGRRFSDEDLAVVQSFANQASVALEYGRAQKELKRLAVLDDRERIAKELHDGVIQALFAVGMGLQATATMSGDSEIEQRIASAVADVDRVIRDLRNYIFGLRPGILADRQLDDALRGVAEEFEAKTGVVTVIDIDPAVASELSSHALDILQLSREALSNIGRHARATTCRLSLGRDRSGNAVLEIDDDGTGFDPARAMGRGQGMRNLRERAVALGGELDIQSSPPEGTTVRVTVPL